MHLDMIYLERKFRFTLNFSIDQKKQEFKQIDTSTSIYIYIMIEDEI